MISRLTGRSPAFLQALHVVKSALNLNAVVQILVEYSHCRDWKAALLRGLREGQRNLPEPDEPETHEFSAQR